MHDVTKDADKLSWTWNCIGMEGNINKADSAIRWLHLSDFHFRSGERYDQDLVVGALLLSLPELVTRFGRPDFAVASGDIAFSGKSLEYSVASEFFDNLLDILKLGKDRLFVVPGNHDIDRSGAIGLSRTLTSSEEADIYFSPSHSFVHVTNKLKHFSAWYEEYIGRAFPQAATYEINKLVLNEKNVNICLFNSSLFCIDDSDSGKLFLGRRQADLAKKK